LFRFKFLPRSGRDHYEGDTLVIDTVGTRTDRPFAMIDLYGTPFTEKLHVVERYRLLDYEDAKEGLERDAKENQRPPVGIDRNYRGKHLQLRFTVEDPGVFTMPWTATITYGRGSTNGRKLSAPKTRMSTTTIRNPRSRLRKSQISEPAGQTLIQQNRLQGPVEQR
jgi:hypothetical protein